MSIPDAPEIMQSINSGEIKRTFQDTFVNDVSEVGPPKRRNRFTRRLRKFEFTLSLTVQQISELDSFFENDLSLGVKPFNWTDPRNNSVYEVRFDESPSDAHLAGDVNTVSVRLSEV